MFCQEIIQESMNKIKIIIRLMPSLIIFFAFAFVSSCRKPGDGIRKEEVTSQDALIDLSFRPGSDGRTSNILNKIEEHMNTVGVAEFTIQEDPNSGIIKISVHSTEIDKVKKFMAEMRYDEA